MTFTASKALSRRRPEASRGSPQTATPDAFLTRHIQPGCPQNAFWIRNLKLWIFLVALLLSSCGGPFAGAGRWYYAADNREARADEVKRDWNVCADVVDLKFGGLAISRNAEVHSAPWFAVRECMVKKGYVYEEASGVRYPSGARTGDK